MHHPNTSQLMYALQKAAEIHHLYEQRYAKGTRESDWVGFYTAYIVGICGDFLPPEMIAQALMETGESDAWFEEAAEAIHARIETRSTDRGFEDTGDDSSGQAAGSRGSDDAGNTLFICTHCFTAFSAPGTCSVCGHPLHEFQPGDSDDPCRCPVINENGEVVTHAPLWWIRNVAPEMAERIELKRKKQK